MITLNTNGITSDLREYAVWLIAMIIVASGFRFAKDIIAFVLNNLYETFILHGPAS